MEDSFRRDENSKLGANFQVKPSLKKPMFEDITEFQLACITSYHTGSHYLAIEKGWMLGSTAHDNHLCT